jgi:ABC-type transporter Mla subunit MlaD
VLAPLAREKERFADFIVQANATGEASAERRGDIARGIELLPDFLAQLRPLMVDLEGFADQGIPLFTDLNAAAPDLGRMIKAQGTLADASRAALPSLGDALERGRPALIDARPLIQDLNKLGTQLKPVSVDLDQLTESLAQTGGPERINDFLYYAALATNGFDSLGHYLRAGLVTNLCSTYITQVEESATCSADFYNTAAEPARLSAAAARNAAPASAGGGSVAPTGSVLGALLGRGESTATARDREQNLRILRERARGGSPGLSGAGEPALDYLLGEDDE